MDPSKKLNGGSGCARARFASKNALTVPMSSQYPSKTCAYSFFLPRRAGITSRPKSTMEFSWVSIAAVFIWLTVTGRSGGDAWVHVDLRRSRSGPGRGRRHQRFDVLDEL